MRLRDILPSTQFMVITGSVLLSAGLVYAADLVTRRSPANSEVAVATTPPANPNWAQALEDIQAQSPLNRLPKAPSEASVNTLLDAATSNNVTDTVARSLFIKISNAKAQGLGTDIPTQDSLIADAASQITKDRGAPAYTDKDLIVVADTKDSEHAYGNAFIIIIKAHPGADLQKTLVTIGLGVDNKDSSKLKALEAIGTEYAALARDLAELPVPATLAPFHLSVVNNLSRMATTYPDMETMVSDPLRGLGGLQLYRSLSDETGRVFTSIGSTLAKNGILFNKDDPGAAWSYFAQ